MNIVKKLNVLYQEATEVAAKGNYVTAFVINLMITMGLAVMAVADVIYRVAIVVIDIHERAFNALCKAYNNTPKKKG